MTLRNPRRTLVTRGLRTIVMLGTALPSAALAQSDVAFPEGVYVERRARLAAGVEGAMVVIAGRYLINPGDELVKQDPNFWCLTGVESPYAVLVIALASGGVTRWTLFMSEQLQFAGGQFPMDEPAFRRPAWNRLRRRLAPGHRRGAGHWCRRVVPTCRIRRTLEGHGARCPRDLRARR